MRLAPTRISHSGFAFRFTYQPGCVGAPPFEPMTTYLPSISWYRSGSGRSLPLFAPRAIRSSVGNGPGPPPIVESHRRAFSGSERYSSTWSLIHFGIASGSFSNSSFSLMMVSLRRDLTVLRNWVPRISYSVRYLLPKKYSRPVLRHEPSVAHAVARSIFCMYGSISGANAG